MLPALPPSTRQLSSGPALRKGLSSVAPDAWRHCERDEADFQVGSIVPELGPRCRGRRGLLACLGRAASPEPDPGAARAKLGIPSDRRVVLVMGGSQGARAINEAVRPLLDGGGFPDAALLWSTGRRDWERYRRYDSPPNRQVRAFWDPIADAYAAADLVVGRAGAMTTAELCAWGLPAIYIPLPGAAAAHQSKNAQALEAAGAALRVEEPELQAEGLGPLLAELLWDPGHLRTMAAAAAARGRPLAARKIAAELIAMVS